MNDNKLEPEKEETPPPPPPSPPPRYITEGIEIDVPQPENKDDK